MERRDPNMNETTNPDAPTGGDQTYGTPRPNTPLGTGQGMETQAGDMPLDPDYGLDPHATNPGYGGTDRGSATTAHIAQGQRQGIEGDNAAVRGTGAAGSGVARGADTTSTADTFSNPEHGMGENAITGNLDQGVTRPTVAGGTNAVGESSLADPNDSGAFEEGTQHADGPRA